MRYTLPMLAKLNIFISSVRSSITTASNPPRRHARMCRKTSAIDLRSSDERMEVGKALARNQPLTAEF